MPKPLILDNKIPIRNLRFPLSGIMGRDTQYKVTGVRKRYEYDSNKQRTEKITGYSYSVTELRTFSSFDVRVDSTTPAITQEEIEAAEDYIFVEIPEDETFVTPYRAEYGSATVSIVAPFLKIVDS